LLAKRKKDQIQNRFLPHIGGYVSQRYER
jgi:hypothetical protein